jgi:hypothetical protein
MARGYVTEMGTVVVENLLCDEKNEVLYVGYVLNDEGKAIEHSRHQLQVLPKGTEHQMRQLRRFVVDCVISCYRMYLYQQEGSKKRRKVAFSNFARVKKYAKDPKVSRQQKIKEWNEFGDYMRSNGLCTTDSPQDMLDDAKTCVMLV